MPDRRAYEARRAYERGIETIIGQPISPWVARRYEVAMARYLADPLKPVRKDMERLANLINRVPAGLEAAFQARELIEQLNGASLKVAYQLRRQLADLAHQVGVPRVRRFGGG